jgi:hypothetical protein
MKRPCFGRFGRARTTGRGASKVAGIVGAAALLGTGHTVLDAIRTASRGLLGW